jgi:hypothetical protein
MCSDSHVDEENGSQLSMRDFIRIFVSVNCLRNGLFQWYDDQKPCLQPQDALLMGGWDTFSKETIMSMIRRSFPRVGFRVNSNELCALFNVIAVAVLNRIAVPEIPFEQLIAPDGHEHVLSRGNQVRQRARIPCSTESAMSLKVSIETVSGYLTLDRPIRRTILTEETFRRVISGYLRLDIGKRVAGEPFESIF